MPKFRKKPVVLEAVQFNQESDIADLDGIEMLPDWVHESCDTCGRFQSLHACISTLEGPMKACPGDWIITGVKGEKYPCKPETFAATYKPVEETNDEGR